MSLNGDRLRELREDRKMAQEDLGRAVGRRGQTILHYESGEHQPSVEILVRLAEILETNMDYLCGKTDYSKPLPGDIGAVLNALEAGNGEDAVKIFAHRAREIAEKTRRKRPGISPKKK